MSPTVARRLVVVNGRVVYDSAAAEPARRETPREQARKLNEAAARWSTIVDLMLHGIRETSGGRVVPDGRRR